MSRAKSRSYVAQATALAVSLSAHISVLALPLVAAHQGDETSTLPLRFVGSTFDVSLTDSPPELAAPLASDDANADGVRSDDAEAHTDGSDNPVAAEPEPEVAANSAPPPTIPPSKDAADLILHATPSEDDKKPPASSKEERPRPSSSPTQPSSVGAAAPQNASAPGPAVASAPAGGFGQEGLEPGVVDLKAAFLKTLPLAAKANAAWREAPLGEAGTIEIRLRLDEDSKLLPVEIARRPGEPSQPELERAALLNRNFLLRGRFALKGTMTPGAEQRLRISALVSEKAADPDQADEPGVMALGLLGGEPPTGAYFTYFSGRHVEFHIEVVGP